MREKGEKRPGISGIDLDPHFGLFTEKHFRAALNLEEARAARSGKPCLLMLLSMAGFEQADRDGFVSDLARTLFSVTRETDLKGWWRANSQIGILFTEVDALSLAALDETQRLINRKILTALRGRVGHLATECISISWSVFPKTLLETREA
jgi:hypothetical protein